MRFRLPIVAAALLALAPLSFAAYTVKGMWDGCKAGSWVATKTTSKMVMPGVETPDSVMETRMTLVKVTDAAWTVKTEMKAGGGDWGNATEQEWPRVAAKGVEEKDLPKPEDLGTEKVTVEGKDYVCKKAKTTVGGNATITWANDDVGALKSETTGEATSSMIVTALAKKVKIGDKEVVCRETKLVSQVMGSESTTVMLTSDGVPTSSVRMETTTSGPMKSTMVTEVTGFEIK